MQQAQPANKTNILSKSTLIEYHDQTAVVIEFERQFLLSISTIRAFDCSSFLKALITLFPLNVSWKKETIGENWIMLIL